MMKVIIGEVRSEAGVHASLILERANGDRRAWFGDADPFQKSVAVAIERMIEDPVFAEWFNG